MSKQELVEIVLKLQRPSKTSKTSSKPPSTDKRRVANNLGRVEPSQVIRVTAALCMMLLTRRLIIGLRFARSAARLWMHI